MGSSDYKLALIFMSFWVWRRICGIADRSFTPSRAGSSTSFRLTLLMNISFNNSPLGRCSEWSIKDTNEKPDNKSTFLTQLIHTNSQEQSAPDLLIIHKPAQINLSRPPWQNKHWDCFVRQRAGFSIAPLPRNDTLLQSSFWGRRRQSDNVIISMISLCHKLTIFGCVGSWLC